jgi:chromosome segregation ATPase
MTAEVTDIRSRIDTLADRISWIDERRKEIKETINTLQREANDLFAERNRLDDAGKALRELMDKPRWRP